MRDVVPSPRIRGAGLPRLMASALLALSVAAAAKAAEPARHFVVRGSASATLSGPGCCGSTAFTGPAELAYSVDDAGQVVLSRIRLDVNDMDVPIRGLFDIVVGHVPLRCAAFTNRIVGVGRVDGPRRLKWSPGAVTVEGFSFGERLGDGSCVDPNFAVAAVNDLELAAEHDPVRDRFRLSGGFRATYDGSAYALALQVEASYLNRPPAARAGLAYPGHDQGGCPARWVPNPAGWVAEANDPGGLRADLWSDSTDPDGSWSRADVQAERWFWAGTTGPEYLVGSGRRVGPAVFGFGPVHRLALLVSDAFGASDQDRCEFQVVDTTPPVVTPPPDAAVACSEWGGARRRSSSPLRSYLASAAAVDAVDTAPSWLTPLVAGVPVTDTTLFRLDIDLGGAGTGVTFRSQDDFGNLGAASGRVHVVDAERPAGSLTLTPSVLPPNGKYYVIAAGITASDRCGPVTVRLDGIKSDAPELDGIDVGGAVYGTDDRSFYVRARTRGPGIPRTYRVYYVVKDRSGNYRQLVGLIAVTAP